MLLLLDALGLGLEQLHAGLRVVGLDRGEGRRVLAEAHREHAALVAEPGLDVVVEGLVLAAVGEPLVDQVGDLRPRVICGENRREKAVEAVLEIALGPDNGVGVERGVRGRDLGDPGLRGDSLAPAVSTAARRDRRDGGDRNANQAQTQGKLHDRGHRSRDYSTVTVFARLRGWSTLRPLRRAM